ncbi:MsnO8 family LLM class oxidoreductase [Salinicoccus albus]|uniref:MsnO8 family LLM class oxidoreductase n=1 Tax=Salinicoccus albus TaxID=418756 RepID=UPI0003621607|nr:MsnO8 family LLM class oxidoreductase [Salinicoccus albus]
MKLGILEQMPQPKGKTAEETAAHTIEMAQYAENLGYERYWFAEHHATRGMVSSSPEVMMAAAAANTERINVGSGGILLPQYSAYKVAAQFSQLESLYPGRIEGGVGRSPGGGEFLRERLADFKPNQVAEYPQKLEDLAGYINREGQIQPAPRTAGKPALYSLGLGENSAKTAAALGIGYVFGHFIKPDRGKASFDAYRNSFTPGLMEAPDAKACVFVVCGADDAHAEYIAQSQHVWLLNVEKGLNSQVPPAEEAEKKMNSLSGKERDSVEKNKRRMIIGGPQKVKAALDYYSDLYQCEDWLILCNLHDWQEKKDSFRRVMEMYS